MSPTRAARILLSALLGVFAAKDVAAESTSEPRWPTSPAASQAVTPTMTRRWYGWQTLSTDAAAGALAYTYYLDPLPRVYGRFDVPIARLRDRHDMGPGSQNQLGESPTASR